MFFDTYFLCSYNYKLAERSFMSDKAKATHSKYLMIDCRCYDVYRNPETFEREMIIKRKSYVACLCYMFESRKRVNHCAVPIVLGSYLDYRIRGLQAILECRAQWGTVILKGVLKIYASFSTFDALSMHIRETKKQKSIDWYTYVPSRESNSSSSTTNNGLAINYRTNVVSWTYKYSTQDSTKSNEWIELLTRSNPFNDRPLLYGSVAATTASAAAGYGNSANNNNNHNNEVAYIQMFDRIIQFPYNMNDLKNRQFVDGAAIIFKYIEYDLNRRRRKRGGGYTKMLQAFEQGTLFQALKKNNFSETEEWCRNYPQNYDNTLHEGRSNKAAYLLPNVTRASNDAVRNSNALTFPSDAMYFFCMLNTKDLKSAGEQNVLADFVIMTEETDQMLLYDYLESINVNHGNILMINGYITPFKVPWTLERLLQTKRVFGHVTTKCYDPYVLFSTRCSIPIKYSDQYDVFFSPAETTHYKISYPEADMLSTTAKLLDIENLRKTAPAKATVSINNIKGSVANVTSPTHKLLMENNLGITCYMQITEKQRREMIDIAVLSHGHDTSHFHEMYRKIAASLNLDEPTIPITETNHGKAMRALSRLYPPEHLFVECRATSNGSTVPFVIERNLNRTKEITEYMSTIFGAEQYYPPSIWNLRLRAVFGNPFGACIEDGVVLDRKTVDQLPKICYNACITIEFMFKTKKHPKSAYFIHIDDSKRGANDSLDSMKNETLIGCVVSPYEAHIKNSKHSLINMTKIGNHYYYLIHFLPKKTGMYQNLNVNHIYDSHSISIIIKGKSEVSIGDGSKVANKYGQKNVCSMTMDLSNCWGITRDGRKVHAQIVYSEVSLIGRLPSGQLYEMLKSDELALGPNGEIIAPIDLVVHTLHPYTNTKVFDIKMDTLTNVNSFDSQNLSNVSLALRSESVLDKALQVLGLHGFDIRFVNTFTIPLGGDIKTRKRRYSTTMELSVSSSSPPPSKIVKNNEDNDDEADVQNVDDNNNDDNDDGGGDDYDDEENIDDDNDDDNDDG